MQITGRICDPFHGKTCVAAGLGVLVIFALAGCAGIASSSQPPSDTTPPAISGISSGSVTTTGAVVTWATNEPADSQVEYGVSASYGQSTPVDSSLTTSHSLSLIGLSASTLYHYRVKTKDAAGNLSASGDFTLTTSAPPDTTSPTVSITSPSSGATVSATITVTASASDNVGVAGVQFLVDGANSGAEDSSSPYTRSLDTTTLSNGNHSLSAVARDAAGNRTTSAAISVTVSNSVPPTMGPLRVLASNPRYFTDGSGKAIYLTGSHTWANLVDQGTTDPPPVFDYSAYLDFLQAHNHNFFRLWTWTLPHANDAERPYSAPLPWPRTGPGTASDGKPKFDLSQFNQAYFDRLRARVIAASQRAIYVSVMLFEGYDLQFMTQGNDGNPFASGNNVNGISCGGTCPHTLPQDSAVTAFEQAYLRKVVDTVNDLDNVLYEVANEAGSYSTSWHYSIINYVKQYEATKPKQHPSGMTFQYANGTDAALYASPAEWISPSTRIPGAADGSKVVVNDTDHSYYWTFLKADGQPAQQVWAWKNFLIGNNLLFMEPYLVVWPGRNAPGPTTVDPYWEVLRNALGRTRTYAQKMDLAGMTPQGSLSSTGFCLANAGVEYLAYQSGSGAFTVNLTAGTYSYEWYNPTTGTVASTGFVTTTGGNQSFTPPFSGDAVLYLKHQ